MIVKNILEGWFYYAFKNPVKEKTAKKRAEICAGCDEKKKSNILTIIIGDKVKEIQGYKCKLCDCPLSAKVRSPDEYCKLKKW